MDTRHRRFATGLAVIATAATVMLVGQPIANGTTATTHLNRRGELVSAEPLRTLSAEQVAEALASDDFDPSVVAHGVTTYRLVYHTVDPRGKPTTASGLLALPRSDDRRLRTVSFTHGTELYRGDAPSVAEDVWGGAPAMTYASAGFAAVAPDYLGLGVGPGPHPWKHVPSETTASLDMLRAARQFVPQTGRSLAREVMVTGFSQGASAALGLARALQEGADRYFQVEAVAPISGAYDFRGAELPALLHSEALFPKAKVVYVSYLLVSWNRLYGLYERPSEVFRAPYHRTIEDLFTGGHTPPAVLEGTPEDLDGLLTERAVWMLEHPTGRLAEAMRVDFEVCTDWTPQVPTRLYIVGDDVEAVTANSANCQAEFATRGVNVPVVDLGTGGHEHSNRLGAAAVVRWFSELR
jgi:Secretory lipase